MPHTFESMVIGSTSAKLEPVSISLARSLFLSTPTMSLAPKFIGKHLDLA